jgi:hypothetical protein
LFLHWYEPGVSAWTVFEMIDLLLALCAFAAIVYAAELMRPGLLPATRPATAERIVLTAGTVALVLVSSQVLNHPPAAQHEGVMYGAWLALGAATLMFAGGVATLALVSLRVTVDRRNAGSPPPPPPAPEETGETRELG